MPFCTPFVPPYRVVVLQWMEHKHSFGSAAMDTYQIFPFVFQWEKQNRIDDGRDGTRDASYSTSNQIMNVRVTIR